jgi:hypothetical protein
MGRKGVKTESVEGIVKTQERFQAQQTEDTSHHLRFPWERLLFRVAGAETVLQLRKSRCMHFIPKSLATRRF